MRLKKNINSKSNNISKVGGPQLTISKRQGVGGESPLRETVFTVKITQRLHKRVTQKPRDDFDDKE